MPRFEQKYIWNRKDGRDKLTTEMPENEIIFSVQESPEGGYEARALGYSIFTQAETMDELKQNVRDALLCHFDDESVLYRLDFTR